MSFHSQLLQKKKITNQTSNQVCTKDFFFFFYYIIIYILFSSLFFVSFSYSCVCCIELDKKKMVFFFYVSTMCLVNLNVHHIKASIDSYFCEIQPSMQKKKNRSADSLHRIFFFFFFMILFILQQQLYTYIFVQSLKKMKHNNLNNYDINYKY